MINKYKIFEGEYPIIYNTTTTTYDLDDVIQEFADYDDQIDDESVGVGLTGKFKGEKCSFFDEYGKEKKGIIHSIKVDSDESENIEDIIIYIRLINDRIPSLTRTYQMSYDNHKIKIKSVPEEEPKIRWYKGGKLS